MTKTLFLLYHDLDSTDHPSEKEDLATRETVVRLDEFERHMAYLAEQGRNVISMRQYFAKQKLGTLALEDIVLTFDDGHVSNHSLAFPVLQKYGFYATFFIIADRVGAQYHMNKEDLQGLVGAGMEIGSHGLTHTYLPKLPRQEVVGELTVSKNLLEKIVEQPVDSFAYPGGHYNAMILACMQESGYTAGASCIVGWNHGTTDPFLFRRVEMRRGTSAQDFQESITAKSIFFYQFIDGVKSGVKKSVGLERYTALRKKIFFLYPFKR